MLHNNITLYVARVCVCVCVWGVCVVCVKYVCGENQGIGCGVCALVCTNWLCDTCVYVCVNVCICVYMCVLCVHVHG